MSLPPPPLNDPAPSGYPAYYQQPRPAKRRPSAGWFVIGGICLVIALACGVVGGFTVAKAFHTDGYVEGADPTTIVLSRSGEHMLFVDPDSDVPTCVVEEGSEQLDQTPVDVSATVDNNHGSWQPFSSFTSTGTEVVVTCDSRGVIGNTVRVGAPNGHDQLVRIGVWILAAGFFGLAGLAALIVVAVLFFGRPSRKVTG